MEIVDYYCMLVAAIALLLGIWLNAVLTALADLSGGKIRKLDKDKQKELIKRAEAWLERRDEFRITIRMLILLNMGLLAAVSYHLSRDLHTGIAVPLLLSVLVATVLYTVATETVGNLRFGTANLSLMSVSMPIVRGVSLLLLPVIWPTLKLRQFAERWHRTEEPEDVTTTEDEIMSLVENDAYEDLDERTLEDHERRMIRGIFDLDETIVREIMTPRVDIKGLAIESSVEDALTRFTESGHSRIPLYRDSIDTIVGLLYAKDLLNREKLNGQNGLEGLKHEPYFVPETKDVKQLLEEFKQHRVQIAVVIDEYGGTAGLVTIEDILEEIVGEILDEYDSNEEETVHVIAADGTLDVDARTPIDEINELLDVDLSEEEDYDTIGGAVNSELGRIPKVDETFQIDNLEILVLEADERKISKLRLRKINEITETDEAS